MKERKRKKKRGGEREKDKPLALLAAVNSSPCLDVALEARLFKRPSIILRIQLVVMNSLCGCHPAGQAKPRLAQ